MKFGLVVHPGIRRTSELGGLITDLMTKLGGYGHEISRIESSNPEAEAESWATTDLIVSIGGDGSFLTAARIAAANGIPMTGIRLPASAQSKPFLPDIEFDEAAMWLMKIANDRSRDILIERRHFLKATHKGHEYIAINEISIGKDALKGTVTVTVSILDREGTPNDGDWQQALSVRADLTMISTATGSTGYSMSTGGPLIHPEDASVVCSHVAPIGFGQRSLVLPGKYNIMMTLEYGDNAALSFDCQTQFKLEPGDRVFISRGHQYSVYRKKSWDFFQRAREVLSWSN